MSSIILSQSPVSYNLFLYPMSDSTVALQIFPTSPATHFDKVDDLPSSPNDDTDYVFASTGSVPAILDMYNLTNHTTETGTINYIQVFTRAKAYPTGQSATGEYKHKITCGAGNALSPNYAPVSTAYQPYSTIWTTRPADGLAWTWTDIDALVAGVSISSPLVTNAPEQRILRPDGAGYCNGLKHGSPTGNGDATNYTYVDEVVHDGNATKVYSFNAVLNYDVYHLEPPGISTGNIQNITLYSVNRYYGSFNPNDAYLMVWRNITLGTYAYSATLIPDVDWTLRSHVWTINPFTSVAWTFADLNAGDLQIGIHTNTQVAGTQINVTQLYAVVNYTQNINPEIRVTQLYIVVNYSPNPSTVTLLAPNEVRYANARKTERFIFPDGTYCIGDHGRGGKKLSLVGTENTNAIQKMRQVQAMLNNPSPVTISGLMDVNQDMAWRLKDFDFEYDIGGDHYDWTAELTSYDYVEGSP